jgi:uncharacterized protein (DUF362 family)
VNPDRRKLLLGSAALAAGAAISQRLFQTPSHADRRPTLSRVAILHAQEYSEKLEDLLMQGLMLFGLNLTDRSVLLKPNLVDYSPGDKINTHPFLVASAAQCFNRLGAKRVVVGEGPGNQRDTRLLLSQSGFAEKLRHLKIDFVDLNRDQLARVKLRASYTDLGHLWLPRTVLESDFVVSMPKIKTHHWSGVTLSLKNMFGVVPGAKYGWPKNILHWKGIQQCVVDLCATVPIQFVIADGIVGMEGNGPLNGAARPLGTVVLADDPVAADATCARLMGLEPGGIPHIRETAKFLGNSSPAMIEQLAEAVQIPETPFHVVPEFEYLRVRHSESNSTPYSVQGG